jgi:hypothetical protein
LFELIFSLIWEIVLQIVGEILFELGFRTLAEPFRDRNRTHLVRALLGVTGTGALTGLISVWLLPQRVLGVTGVPGISLVVAPIANAAAMEAIGQMFEARTGKRPYIATYWAGGLFALSMALVRFILIAP